MALAIIFGRGSAGGGQPHRPGPVRGCRRSPDVVGLCHSGQATIVGHRFFAVLGSKVRRGALLRPEKHNELVCKSCWSLKIALRETLAATSIGIGRRSIRRRIFASTGL